MTTSYSYDDPSLQATLPVQLTKKLHRQVPEYLRPDLDANKEYGKIVLITGGGANLGLTAAKTWIKAGAAGVVIAARREKVLHEAAQALEDLAAGSGTTVLAVVTDVKVYASVENLFKKIQETFARPVDVVIANAGGNLHPFNRLAEEKPENWCEVIETNTLGTHHTIHAWIHSQPDPKNPSGTAILVSSAASGFVMPGLSAYGISKLAAHRYMEYLHVEHPNIRSFILNPGIVYNEHYESAPDFLACCGDESEMMGCASLYLASDRAEYLRGSFTSVNWDIEEMEAHKKEIENGLLKIKWITALPCAGGKGFSS